MGWTKTACRVAVTLGLLPFLESVSRADEVADFYRGKNVELQIGFGPGGGNDVWGRMVSRHMPRHLPGSPTFIPKNVPAAGSLVVAIRKAYATPKPVVARTAELLSQ